MTSNLCNVHKKKPCPINCEFNLNEKNEEIISESGIILIIKLNLEYDTPSNSSDEDYEERLEIEE